MGRKKVRCKPGERLLKRSTPKEKMSTLRENLPAWILCSASSCCVYRAPSQESAPPTNGAPTVFPLPLVAFVNAHVLSILLFFMHPTNYYVVL